MDMAAINGVLKDLGAQPSTLQWDDLDTKRKKLRAKIGIPLKYDTEFTSGEI
jgi:hypothetical protein